MIYKYNQFLYTEQQQWFDLDFVKECLRPVFLSHISYYPGPGDLTVFSLDLIYLPILPIELVDLIIELVK